MTTTCPNGHTSESSDYCDTCGAPISSSAPPPAEVQEAPPAKVPAPAGVQSCPNCGEDAAPDALFCENCGYDFTTGTMPRATTPDTPAAPPGPAPAPAPAPAPPPVKIEWVVERWVDPDWYEAQQAGDPCPSPGLPVVVPLTTKSVLVGRPSKSRNITPDIDCGDDSGVSRRQTQLTTDGQRWWVEDLQSANGTYVGPASGPLPTTPVPPGQRKELEEDDRIYVGAWTRLVVRRATPAEAAGQA